MHNTAIKTAPNDNVAIVATPTGLKRGSIVLGTTVLVEEIPMGHKVALQTLEMGDEVRRYGQVIGYATRTIEKGSWVRARPERRDGPRAVPPHQPLRLRRARDGAGQ